MITSQCYSKEILDFIERNLITLANPDFQQLVTRQISQPSGLSIISVLQDFGLNQDDAFVLANRLRRPNFKLWKVPPYPGFLRAYLYQAITSDFGLADWVKSEFYAFNKSFNDLTLYEVKSILGAVNLYCEEDDQDFCFYYFFDNGFDELYSTTTDSLELATYVQSFESSNFDFKLRSHGVLAGENDELDVESLDDEMDNFHYCQFPTLFTDIQACSFDQGGLIVMQLFGSQIYELYSSDGTFIEGPCHDLDLLIDGKYVFRSSGNKPGFHISQISFSEVQLVGIDLVCRGMEVKYIHGYGDLDSTAVVSEVDIQHRDRLQIELGTCINQRIENFTQPRTIDEVRAILLSEKTNYITSPDLSLFYQNNKELALIAVKRDPLAYTLIQPFLKIDREIQLLAAANRNHCDTHSIHIDIDNPIDTFTDDLPF